MNENLLWLLYLVSGAVAFAGIHYRRWRITLAMITGALVTALGWIILFLMTDESERPEWVNLDLSLNICFGLIFAGAGAGLAHFLLMRNRRADEENPRGEL